MVIQQLRSQWRLIQFVGTLVVLSAGALLLSYFVLSEVLTGPEATAIATIWLVALTGVYATVTYQTLHETRKSRHQEIMPAFEFAALEYRSTLANIGNGPARDLDVTLSLLPRGPTHRIRRENVPAGGDLVIPVEPFSSIGDRTFRDLQIEQADIDWEEYDDDEEFWKEFDDYPYERLEVNGTCNTIWGDEMEIDLEYQV